MQRTLPNILRLDVLTIVRCCHALRRPGVGSGAPPHPAPSIASEDSIITPCYSILSCAAGQGWVHEPTPLVLHLPPAMLEEMTPKQKAAKAAKVGVGHE